MPQRLVRMLMAALVLLPVPALAAPLLIWDPAASPSLSARLGDYRIALHYDDAADEAVLDVDLPGMPHLHRAESAVTSWVPLRLEVLRLDPAVPGAQLVITSYTGGAHCCTERAVYLAGPRGWKELAVEDQGLPEGLPLIADRDGDGIPDIISEDADFYDVFGPHGESGAPLRVYHLSAGTLADVTMRPGFTALRRQAMAFWEQGCRTHKNGQCAAFVAEAARLGDYDRAWRVMLASYRHEPQTNFPRLLKAFLAEHRYTPVAAR